MDRLLLTILLSVIYSGAAHAGTLPVFDSEFSCVEPTTAERYVNDFNIDIPSFGGLDLCNPKVDSKKLFNDLQLIEQGAFAGSAQNVFIKNFVAASGYYSWMQQQTHGVQRGNDIPWATAYNAGGYFTMQDGWAQLSTLGRVGTIIHEARHTEGYYHTICDHGPYKNSHLAGCDESVDAGGSHGVEMEYYARVLLEGQNFHPVYQSMARMMLLARANFVFNENPMAAKDILLVRTRDGLMSLQEEQKSILDWQLAGSESFKLKRTSLGATLLDLPHGAWSIDLARPDIAPALNDDYSYFKLLKMAPPAALTDVEEIDINLGRYVYAIDKQDRLYSYVFGQGEWSRPATLTNVDRLATANPLGQAGLFAVFKDQTYCPIQVPNLLCDRSPMPWPPDAKRFVEFKNTTLRLGTDGAVYDSRGQIWSELAGEDVLDLILVPHFDVFD